MQILYNFGRTFYKFLVNIQNIKYYSCIRNVLRVTMTINIYSNGYLLGTNKNKIIFRSSHINILLNGAPMTTYKIQI